mgnify:CR=1 FL=1
MLNINNRVHINYHNFPNNFTMNAMRSIKSLASYSFVFGSIGKNKVHAVFIIQSSLLTHNSVIFFFLIGAARTGLTKSGLLKIFNTTDFF